MIRVAATDVEVEGYDEDSRRINEIYRSVGDDGAKAWPAPLCDATSIIAHECIPGQVWARLQGQKSAPLAFSTIAVHSI